MQNLMKSRVPLALLLVLLPGAARAQASVEVEADPIAYAVNGYSGHLAAFLTERVRAQVGAFGADVPEWLHGNDGFDIRTRGVTVKMDRYFSMRREGTFIGLDGDYSRVRYRHDESGESTSRNLYGLGPRIGYRFNLGSRLFVVPWMSVRYVFNTSDVTLGGERLEESEVAVFPTVHIGFRF